MSLIPPGVIEQYNLNKLKDDKGFVYVKIRKGMYGLPQAGRNAHDQLKAHLNDFGIKYEQHEDIEHLIAALKKIYTVTIDWK
eukprot:7934812-Ditylum_brightwellii.AAC.1